MTKKKSPVSPSWIQEVTPDDEVMRAFYLGQNRRVAPNVDGNLTYPTDSKDDPQIGSSSIEDLRDTTTEENSREGKRTVENSTEQKRTAGNKTEENSREQDKTSESAHNSNQLERLESPRLKVINNEKPVTTETSSQPKQVEAKPQNEDRPASVFRDFNKRPNSIERDAVPKGLFLGSTKVLYDVLFYRTRGAMPSARKLQITSAELCKLASMSDKTLWKHLRYLESIGLVARLTDSEQLQMGFKRGAGNVFEVFIPDEIDLGKAQRVAASGKIWKQQGEDFPQQYSREENSTAGKNLPGTVGKNLPYPSPATSNESTLSDSLIHVKTCNHEEESDALGKLSFYLSDIFSSYLGRDLSIEEKLGIIATLTEELLDIVHQGLQGNAEHGREIENTVAWFTSMIGQRLSGRHRKRSPQEALRSAIWVSLREMERKRGGHVTGEERGEIELELINQLAPKFNKTVPNASLFIKEHITNWWMALDKTRMERKTKK